MKWENWTDFCGRNVGIASCVLDYMGRSLQYFEAANSEHLEHYIVHQLDYVAVRPVSSLSLTNVSVSSDGGRSTMVVFYQLLPDERPCSRIEEVGDVMNGGIRGTIQKLEQEHGDALRVNVIMCAHERVGDLNAWGFCTYDAFELYRVPDGRLPD